jgi:hypothetical protein
MLAFRAATPPPQIGPSSEGTKVSSSSARSVEMDSNKKKQKDLALGLTLGEATSSLGMHICTNTHSRIHIH